MTVTDALLAPLLAAEPSRPLITYYDDVRGERIELSGATFDNWVAKTANLLRDECDVEPGATVAVLLPAHWQTAAALFATWSCGACVVGPEGVDGADVALADVVTFGAAAGAGLVVGFSLDAFGRGVGVNLPAGAIDYAGDVRVHGDHFDALAPVPDDAPAWGSDSVATVVATARGRAAELGLGPGDRVLSTLDWSTTPRTSGLVDGLLAVLAAGASLVQVRNPDGDQDRRGAAEKITRRW